MNKKKFETKLTFSQEKDINQQAFNHFGFQKYKYFFSVFTRKFLRMNDYFEGFEYERAP